MNNILFVDDEPNIISGLKRTLRSMRQDYNFLFAHSGAEALEVISEHRIDGIVSDMRMPKMSGLELLIAVKKMRPETVRIILSGQADKDDMIQAIGVAHQFMLKPTPKDILARTMGSIRDFSKWIPGEKLRKFVAGLDTLPTLPSNYSQLVSSLTNKDYPFDSFLSLFSSDVALGAKILQLANSSFFVSDIQKCNMIKATRFLGNDLIRRLALSDSTFKPLEIIHLESTLEALWQRSEKTALLAREIALNAGLDDAEANDIHNTALLQHIGAIIQMLFNPDGYMSLYPDEESLINPKIDEEINMFGCSYDRIGAGFMSIWGIPEIMVSSIGHHLDMTGYENESDKPGAVECIHVANQIMVSQSLGGECHSAMELLDKFGLPAAVIQQKANELLVCQARAWN